VGLAMAFLAASLVAFRLAVAAVYLATSITSVLVLGGDFWTFATDLHLYADVGGGALWFSNQSLDPVTIVGTCIASPDLGLRS